jgi:uncharacterized protein YceK
VLSAFLVLLLIASCGTYIVRCDGEYEAEKFFGAYPYQEVLVDVFMIGLTPEEGVPGLLGLFSLPIDLALDTVFLPFDLLWWSQGQEKEMSLRGFH